MINLVSGQVPTSSNILYILGDNLTREDMRVMDGTANQRKHSSAVAWNALQVLWRGRRTNITATPGWSKIRCRQGRSFAPHNDISHILAAAPVTGHQNVATDLNLQNVKNDKSNTATVMTAPEFLLIWNQIITFQSPVWIKTQWWCLVRGRIKSPGGHVGNIKG